jgi:hypothetical protein
MRFGRDAVDGEDVFRVSEGDSDGTLQFILIAGANESCDTPDSGAHGGDDAAADELRQYRVEIWRVFRGKVADALSVKADRDCSAVVRIIGLRHEFCDPVGFELNVPRRTCLVYCCKNLCLAVRLTDNVEPGFARGGDVDARSTSSTLLGGCSLLAVGAVSEIDGENSLEFFEDAVMTQAAPDAFGWVSLRVVRKRCAALTRVAWWFQPSQVRPSKCASPRPVFSSR